MVNTVIAYYKIKFSKFTLHERFVLHEGRPELLKPGTKLLAYAKVFIRCEEIEGHLFM